jgi:Reverse transcriptase (RNA-dependent DNA polymerase)
MGYYHIPLDDESQKLCTTILPWGKYKYLRIGIKNSPDIFQAIMHDIPGDLEYSSAYIDDILVTSSGNFKDHLDKIVEVLK